MYLGSDESGTLDGVGESTAVLTSTCFAAIREVSILCALLPARIGGLVCGPKEPEVPIGVALKQYESYE